MARFLMRNETRRPIPAGTMAPLSAMMTTLRFSTSICFHTPRASPSFRPWNPVRLIRSRSSPAVNFPGSRGTRGCLRNSLFPSRPMPPAERACVEKASSSVRKRDKVHGHPRRGARLKLLEYKGKEVLARHGIPVPRGGLVPAQAQLASLSYPVALKAQVLAGGRGKAGGIRLVSTAKEAESALDAILSLTIGGYRVKQVYAEERLDIAQELYLSITIDRSARVPLLMASTQGGVDVESVPEEGLFRAHIPPLVGPQPFLFRALRKRLGL